MTYIYFAVKPMVILLHNPKVMYDVHASNNLYGKIKGPWNIGHTDLHFMTHKSMSQDWALSDQLYA